LQLHDEGYNIYFFGMAVRIGPYVYAIVYSWISYRQLICMKLGPAWIPLADPAEPIAAATAVRQGEACRHVLRSSITTLIGASSIETWYAINIGYQDKPCGE
jgi:hypothetical protein